MISLEDAVIARIKREDEEYEVLVDPYKSRDLKEGKDVDLEEVVAARDVYIDSEKGKKASDKELNKAFGTNNFGELAEKIIKKGEIQLTTEQKKEMREKKRKQVLSWLKRNSINPKTNNPHPRNRIENAVEKVGHHFDEHKSVKNQAEEVLDKIRKELPIKVEKLKIAVKIPPEHAGKASNVLHSYDIEKEEWKDDGSYIVVVKIPAGVQDELYQKVNSITHGENETKIIEEKKEGV